MIEEIEEKVDQSVAIKKKSFLSNKDLFRKTGEN